MRKYIAFLLVFVCFGNGGRVTASSDRVKAGVSGVAAVACALGSLYCFNQAAKNQDAELARKRKLYKFFGYALAAGAVGGGAYCGYKLYDLWTRIVNDDIIQGDIVTLKKLMAASVQDYCAMFSEDVRENLEFPKEMTHEGIARYFRYELNKVDSGSMLAYNIWDNRANKMVGSIQIRERGDGPGQLGMWLNENYRGGGRIQEALHLISKAYFEKNPQERRYDAHVRVWNRRSKRAMEKFGFKQIGDYLEDGAVRGHVLEFDRQATDQRGN